jgi:hypothetical protein
MINVMPIRLRTDVYHGRRSHSLLNPQNFRHDHVDATAVLVPYSDSYMILLYPTIG